MTLVERLRLEVRIEALEAEITDLVRVGGQHLKMLSDEENKRLAQLDRLHEAEKVVEDLRRWLKEPIHLDYQMTNALATYDKAVK